MSTQSFLRRRQKENLQKALIESQCPHLRKRILILLLRNDGKTYQEISDFIGCSYRSVTYWCIHGDPDNLETLKDGREKGNHRKATKAYIELLMETIEKSPAKLGFEFSRWTAEKLATYLAQETGIKLSGVQVRRILHQQKARLPVGKIQPRGKAKLRDIQRKTA